MPHTAQIMPENSITKKQNKIRYIQINPQDLADIVRPAGTDF
jgi:hypothetical protein